MIGISLIGAIRNQPVASHTSIPIGSIVASASGVIAAMAAVVTVYFAAATPAVREFRDQVAERLPAAAGHAAPR